MIVEESPASVLNRPAPRTVFLRKALQYDFFPFYEDGETLLSTLGWETMENAFTGPKNDLPEIWLQISPSGTPHVDIEGLLGKKDCEIYQATALSEREPQPFVRLSSYHFRIDAAQPDHYQWLVDSLPTGQDLGVLLLQKQNSHTAHSGTQVMQSVLSIHQLVSALLKRGRSRIWGITAGAFKVQPMEQVLPSQRAVSTLLAGILEEHPPLRGAVLDLGAHEPLSPAILMSLLERKARQPLVVRSGEAYQPVLKAKDQPHSKGAQLRAGGVYLIIGGSSGLGSQLVTHLLSFRPEKIIVTGTRPADKLPTALQSALRASQIEYWPGSATSKENLATVVAQLQENYGSISGIIYAAGSVAFGSLVQRRQQELKKVLSSKIVGAYHLSQIIETVEVDFVLLVSSMSSLAPRWSKGIVDYAVANAYLETLAYQKNSTRTTWMACSWGLWKEVGNARGLSGAVKGIALKDGLASFESALAIRQPHLIVLPKKEHAEFSTAYSSDFKIQDDLAVQEIKEERHAKKEALPAQKTEPAALDQTNYELLRNYIAEAVELEPHEVKDDTSFYDLGLDSLNAVDLVQKIERELQVKLHPTLLFEHDSLGALIQFLKSEDGAPESIGLKPEGLPSSTQRSGHKLGLIGAQKTFYAQQQFFPDIPCNMMVNLSVEQELDPGVSQKALEELLQKHDSLRLSFDITSEGPVQFVQENLQAEVEFKHFNSVAEVQSFEDELINHVFDLSRPPLFKLAIVKWQPDKTTIMLSMHHLIADAWSMHILLESFLEIYGCILRGDQATIAPESNFQDYVRFLGEKEQKSPPQPIKDYWIKQLNGAAWSLPLPYKIPAGKKGAFSMVLGSLSKEATRQLLDKASEEKLSVFQITLAALFVVLHQHTKRADIIVRIANANRHEDYPGIDKLTGCLADALPLRIRLDDSKDIVPVALKVKQRLHDALKFVGLSSQDIAELPIGRSDKGPVVLSPVGLSFVPMHHLAKKMGTKFTDVRCRTALPFTDISLICFLEEGQLKCCWNFDKALFANSEIERLKSNFLSTLEGKRTSHSKIYAPLEMPEQQLFPEHKLLHEKVWQACREYGDKTAIVEEDQRLTYSELLQESKRAANSLLSHLQAHEKIVAVYAYPGGGAIVGILGILSAGKAFVPLDPDWPAGKIENILSHSGVTTILTSAVLLGHLEEKIKACSIDRIFIIGKSAALDTGVSAAKRIMVQEEQSTKKPELALHGIAPGLAYVMYTSGTSGTSKGVMVEHQAVGLFLDWIAETFAIDARDRFILTSSLGFGGSIRQIFSSLLAGATLYPIDRAAFKDPQLLFAFLQRHQITLFNTVPSVIDSLLDRAEFLSGKGRQLPGLTHLRQLFLGGDVLQLQTIQKWRKYFGYNCSIANLYGSTETIVNASAYFVEREAIAGAGQCPIGYQKKGTVVRLLNEAQKICGVGEVGQIVVGGPCLAKGYYREKGLTREKFVYLDFPDYAGTFFLTGDLGKVDADGKLHFMGRNDDQIQIYGNRVELTEIEAVIYQTQQVKQAAVVDLKTEGEHWVAAFVELNPGGIKITGQQIRQYIKANLPEYMVPHKVIILEQTPLNHAGKIDRIALRKLLAEALSGQEEQTVPKNSLSPTEKKIAEVWRKMLHVKEVGPDDDFFDLGGDSIRALIMLYDLRGHFKVLPKAVSVFNNRTLRALAYEIDQLNTNSATARVPKLESMPGQNGTHPLSPSQKGFVLLQKLFPKSAPNWVGLLQVEGVFEMDTLQQAFRVLLRRHPMLRTVFVKERGKTVQKVLDLQDPPVESFDLTNYTDEDRLQFLASEKEKLQARQYELSQFPLFEIRLYKTTAGSGIIGICMHHIITDGWSTQVLTNDLLKVYDQSLNHLTPDLGPEPPRYTALLPYLSDRVESGPETRMKQLVDFWESTLRDLPAFEPPSDTAANEKKQAQLILPASIRDDLQKWSRENGITLYKTLLTLFARALYQLNHENDLLINTAVNGRDLPHPKVGSVIGCFARNLPLRIRLNEEGSLIDQIRIVDQSFLSSLEHQDIPTTKLFEIAARLGNASSVFAVNRFYFSFMDFTSLSNYSSSNLSILWDQSTFSFSAGGAGSEIMLGVSVSEEVRININGYAPSEDKERLMTILKQEIYATTDKEKALDAALIAYLPDSETIEFLIPAQTGSSLSQNWKSLLFPGNRPQLVEQTETPIGVSGLILLPYNMDELRKLPRPSLHELLLEGIEIAKQQGARAISLAGMLPSMTNYGYGLVEEMPVASSPSSNRYLTSGHACTVIAVVKTIQKVLEVLNISISELKVAIVGYGSIGQSSLALLLELTDQPLELMIIEEERQLSNLLAPLAELKARFSNKMSVYTNRGQEVAPEVYQADLIIGASSSGSILDINLLKPGTVLIDDSFPSIINVPKSIERMQKKRDVLAVGGGKLEIGQLARQHFVRGLPESAVSSILSKLGVQGMPGCRVESLLQSNEPALPAVVGLVSPQVARQYLAKINALNIDAADLHLGSHAISKEVLESMKQLFTLRFHKPHSNE